MRLLLCFSFVLLALATEKPQRWRAPFPERHRSCNPSDPILIEQSNRLAANGRANGDPCLSASQCASGFCVCSKAGGLECAPPPHCPQAPPTGDANCYLSSNVTCTYGRTCCCGVCKPEQFWVCSSTGIWIGAFAQTDCPGCEVTSCPLVPFKHGTKCDADLYCEYGSCSCPGAADQPQTLARCQDGYWSVVTNPQCSCGRTCPQAPPKDGSSCTVVDQDCSYGSYCCCPPCSPVESVPEFVAYCTAFDDGSLSWDVTNMKSILQCPSVCNECTPRHYRYEVDPVRNSFNGGNSDGHRALVTGMYIEEGANLQIRVESTARWGIGVGQEVPATGSPTATYAWPGPPALEFPVGALLARVGRGNWFLAASFNAPADTSGVLELMQWDSSSDDNGVHRLSVDVSTKPASCDPCYGIFCTLSIPFCGDGTILYKWTKPGECCPSHACIPRPNEGCPAVPPSGACTTEGLNCVYNPFCCCGNGAQGDCIYTQIALCSQGEWHIALAMPAPCNCNADPCAEIACAMAMPSCEPGYEVYSYRKPGGCCDSFGCIPSNPASCPAEVPSGSCSGDMNCQYSPFCCCGNGSPGDCVMTTHAVCGGGEWHIAMASIMCPPSCVADPCADIACAMAMPACEAGQEVYSYRKPGACCDSYGCVPVNTATCPAEQPTPGDACSQEMNCQYSPHCCCGDGSPNDCIMTTFADCAGGQWQLAMADIQCPLCGDAAMAHPITVDSP